MEADVCNWQLTADFTAAKKEGRDKGSTFD